MALKVGFWSNKSHYLNRMTFRQLVVAYFQYYAIQAYLVLAAGSIYVAVSQSTAPWLEGLSAAVAVVLYPLAWYTLHRFVLHGQYLFKSRLTAKVWKRIHFDHHQDPNHLEILFGALYTTLPTIALITLPTGYLINGLSGAASAFAAGLLTTCFYEFCHCIQHLSYTPKNKFIAEMKRLHMAHHFHDETGNFGITNFFWDKLFGTHYENVAGRSKSATVFNLGYDKKVAETYPWVANLSDGIHNSPMEKRSKHSQAEERQQKAA
ncbi:MAG: sterol desaturase family protein [Pseudomonadota bacterium]